MVARKFVVQHDGSSFDLDYDTDDGFEVLKFQLFSLTSIPPDQQKILGGDDNTAVSDDSDLESVSDKLRLVSIDEDENGEQVEKSVADFMKSDEELARKLQKKDGCDYLVWDDNEVYEKLREAYENLKEDYEKLHEDNDELNETNKDLKEHIKDLKKEIKEMKEETKNLAIHNKNLKEKKKKLKAKYKSLWRMFMLMLVLLCVCWWMANEQWESSSFKMRMIH